ncbi:glycoside hydrolase family 18 protein [Gelatoporia subvermispora B]|uniref:Glycoside hydrolase family 18 protein n=1 Tax=Ceriporiopsis subvermispora (strain B) TaxID=914234 RepID=M2R2P6_CERS8|nr:glycoside hydrolase family 18 protein [Gelatoporia subvermispora B]
MLVAFSSIVLAVPLPNTASQEPTQTANRTVPAAPHFVVYGDEWISGENGPPDVSEIKGYNVFALSFLLASGPVDQAQEWASLTDAQRSSIKAEYKAAGISLIVSAFGSTDAPTTSGADPNKTADMMAQWVKQYDLDGIDIDYEDFKAMESKDSEAENWLISFHKRLRTQLFKGQYIITHAPVAPWFSPNPSWPGGGYLKVDQEIGPLVDWYNIQFYNQGTSEYTTCTNLLTTSGGAFPNSSVFEIAAAGVPLDKLVIGKPANAADADNGYVDPSTLAQCLEQAKSQGWDAGAMAWEFPGAASDWITTVRSQAFPL